MEYGRREPIRGASAIEPTAFTMKSIQELLDEAGTDIQVTPVTAPPAQMPASKSQLQQPQHLRNPEAMPVVQRPATPRVVTQRPAAKPALRTSSAPAFEAEKTAAPMPLPAAMASNVTQFPPLKAEPEEKPRSFLKRLIGA